jgi:ribosomal protein S18 acetylase RimI-like enzyme
MHDRCDAFSIRRYVPRDREAVWSLHNEVLHTAGAHLGNGQWDDDLHDIEGSYLENRGEFLVGETNGKLVAMGAVKKTGADAAEIKRMRVESRFRGRSFGKRMLSLLEERAADLGYSLLRLDTSLGQTAARSLYEKNGYRETEHGRIGHLECVFMEKGIGRSRG